MNKARSIWAGTLSVGFLALLCVQRVDAAAVVYADSGAQVADLSGPADPLAQFRAALGDNRGVGPNPGGLPGRREINWDAAGLDAVADPNLMPADQFNRVAAPFARGAQFSTPGSGFFVSRRCEQDGAAPPCGGSNILFGFGPDAGQNVNFRAFSEQRIFSPVGSNIMDVTFATPGIPGQRATTNAFGAIFLDVETANLTLMEFFDIHDALLGSFAVPADVDAGFSFLGVQFNAGELIGRVRITLGDMVLLGHGQFDAVRNDLVALDDFLYAEPVRIGEPGSLALLGLVGVAALARRCVKGRASA